MVEDVRRIWRPRRWVQVAAVGVLLLVLGWLPGTTSDDLPWMAGAAAVGAAAAYAALVSKIVLSPDSVRLVNPWGTQTLPRAGVVAVRPGQWGAEFVTADGRRHVAFAVQCTMPRPGQAPRWVDLAMATTGEDPRSDPGSRPLGWRDLTLLQLLGVAPMLFGGSELVSGDWWFGVAIGLLGIALLRIDANRSSRGNRPPRVEGR
jgi:hypothetical protein